jgi:hypothetical protein
MIHMTCMDFVESGSATNMAVEPPTQDDRSKEKHLLCVLHVNFLLAA